MFDALPDGWQRGKLLDFFQLQRGFDLPVQRRIAGSVPVIASNGQVGMHNESPIAAPAVITGRSGTIGKVLYSPSPCWPLNTTLFVSDFKGADPLFVSYFLQYFPLKAHASGTGVPTLNRNDVHAADISFPPIDEQRRIAGVLRSLDEAIIAARTAAEVAARVFCSTRDELMEEARRNCDEIVVAAALVKNRGEKLRKLQTTAYQERGAYPIVDQGSDFICGYTDDKTALWPYSLPVIVFGDHTLALKFVDFPFAIGADGTQCLTSKVGIRPRFLYYAIQSLDLSSEGYARHFKVLKEKLIPLPDEERQDDISTALLAVERGHIDALACVNGMEQAKQAVSRDLLSGHVRVPV